MKMKLKSFYVGLIALCLCFLSVTEAAGDTANVEIDGIAYYLSDNYGTASVLANSYKGDVVIPEKVVYQGKEYVVNYVTSGAFDKNIRITSLTLPPSITGFGSDLSECAFLERINISSLESFCGMDVWSGKTLFPNADTGLYLNGKLVKSATVTNKEPNTAFKGYKMLKSITFNNPESTSFYGKFFNQFTTVDTIRFMSPKSIMSPNDINAKFIYVYGDMELHNYSTLTTNADFLYVGGKITVNDKSMGASYAKAKLCIINSRGNGDFLNYCAGIDTCVFTPVITENKYNSNSGYYSYKVKYPIFLSPKIRISSAGRDVYVVNRDSAMAEMSEYQKDEYGKYIKSIFTMENPTLKEYEYSGVSPFSNLKIEDNTDLIKTTWDADRLKKDVGDYEEMPISFNVHGMKYDISLPYKYSITKASLTILANNDKREYGENNPEFSCTYMGFKNGETEDDLVTKPTIYTTASKESPVGSYPIIPVNAQSLNYFIDYKEGALTVVPASQTITWEQNLTKAKVGDIIELSATSSANLKVKFTSSNTAIADVYTSNGKTYMECLAVGSARITASQAGDSNHSEADDIVKRITVEAESTAISDIEAEAGKIAGYYTIDGRKVETPVKGLYIVKYANGRMRKVIVK